MQKLKKKESGDWKGCCTEIKKNNKVGETEKGDLIPGVLEEE